MSKAQKFVQKQNKALAKAKAKGLLVNVDDSGAVTVTKTRLAGAAAQAATTGSQVKVVTDDDAEMFQSYQAMQGYRLMLQSQQQQHGGN